MCSSHNPIHYDLGDEAAVKERLDVILSLTIPNFDISPIDPFGHFLPTSGDNTAASLIPEEPTTPYRTTVSTMATAPDATAQTLVDPREDEDVQSTNSTLSTYSCFSESIFGDAVGEHDIGFGQRRLILQAWIRDFKSKYDSIKPHAIEDAELEIQNTCGGVDLFRTKIYDAVNDWIIEIHRSFSPNTDSQRPIFERLLVWVKAIARILSKRPPFYPMGDRLESRLRLPPDDAILPPQRARSTSTKRRPLPEEDTSILTQQPPNKQGTLSTTSRHQDPLTPRRQLPSTPMIIGENQGPTIMAPVFSLGAAFGGVTATRTVQTQH